MIRQIGKLLPPLSLLLVLTATTRGDDIYIYGKDGAPPLSPLWTGVSVLRIENEQLYFRSSSGGERSADLKSVFRLNVQSDPSLSAGEEAYTAASWDKAIENYQKAIRTNDAWKIRWISPRLFNAAARTQRFDAALTAYIGLAKTDPAAAATMKPTLPEKGSKYLDVAARDLDAVVRSTTVNPQKQALLSLLLDVHMARGDQAAIRTTADQLLGMATDVSDPRLVGLVAEIHLGQARLALDSKKYDQIQPPIDKIAATLADPRQQAEALFLIAQAKRGAAGKDNREAQMDAAISFMRVVTHFSNSEDKPFVGASLLAAAQISETLDDLPAAKNLYSQLLAEFPQTPFAQQATAAIERLSAAK